MFGFLLKVIIFAGIAVIGFSYLSQKNPQLSKTLLDTKTQIQSGQLPKIADLDLNLISKNVSSSLDQLVTHSNANSPVVLGVKITNDSLNALVDIIQKLPPEQIDQLKSAICSPATDSAGL